MDFSATDGPRKRFLKKTRNITRGPIFVFPHGGSDPRFAAVGRRVQPIGLITGEELRVKLKARWVQVGFG